MLMVFENMKSDITRHFWLFDTFDGLPEPDVKDGTRANKIYNDLHNMTTIPAHIIEFVIIWCKSFYILWNYGIIRLRFINLK